MRAVNTFWVAVVILLSLSATVHASYQEVVLADGPEAFWRFGESEGNAALDSSGHGRNGTYSGLTLGQPGAIVGDSDTSIFFDSSDYIKTDATDLMPNMDSWSIEAWVKVTSIGSFLPTVSWYAGGYYLYHDSAYLLSINEKGQPEYYLRDYYGKDIAVVSTTPITDSAWHHLVGVLDRQGGSIKLYLDGNEVASAPAIGIGLISDGSAIPVQLGDLYRSWSNSWYFAGMMDEVAIYRVALSPERVRLHNDTGRGLTSDGDGDGVLDGLDRCPGTPPGLPVDSNGCITQCPSGPSQDAIDLAVQSALAAQGAAISEKEATISALNVDNATLTASVASKDESIAALKSQVTALNATISDLQQQVATLDAQISVMYTKQQLDQAVLSVQQAMAATLPATLSTVFQDPGFLMPGGTLTEQINYLTSAIGKMPSGQIKKLQEFLTP